MLKNITHIILKRIILIVTTVIIFIVGSIVYLQFLSAPTYKASVQMIANDNVDQLPVYSTLLSDNQTFTQSILSIAKKTDNNIKADDTKALSLSYTAGNPLFSISATSKNAKSAAELANVGAAYFAANVGKYVFGVNVSILTKAVVPTEPVRPKRSQVLMLGVIMGFFIGIALAFIEELFVNRSLDNDYVTNVIGFKDLGAFSLDKKNVQQ